MLTEWELKDKALTISSDNAANAIAGLALTHIDHQRCFAHTLQLVIHYAISSQRSVNDMLAICRRIAGHFNRSPLAHHRLAILYKKNTTSVNTTSSRMCLLVGIVPSTCCSVFWNKNALVE